MDNKVCEWCGSSFERARKLSDNQWNDRKFCSKKCSGSKLRLDINEIQSQYKSGLSATEIANSIGCASITIMRLLKSNNVDVRTRPEIGKLSHSKPDVKMKLSIAATGRKLPESAKEKLRERVGDKNHNWGGGLTISKGGYLVFTNSPANGINRNKHLHVVICEYKYGRKMKKGEHVHHIDGNKLNNHPDNLLILTASDHAKLHAKERNNARYESMQLHGKNREFGVEIYT